MARHEGVVRWRLATWVAASTLAVLVACTTGGSTQTSSQPVPTPGIPARALSCPKRSAPWLAKNDLTGITHTLVPGDPQQLVACFHNSMATSRSRIVVSDTQEVGQLVDALNGQKLSPEILGHTGKRPVFSCPVTYGGYAEWDLSFVYADGQVLALRVGGDSCLGASNGRRFAFLDNQTRRQVTRLFL